ncbi:porin [Prolixibacteraceae bacterium Z1-6]|uniref:Porin n=1 Tax=Draconibacterium aestuarii TaxID=2998507 RepID=A0A9X3J6V9_9BACT|nr:porin [Prolixibacteraceae bacterium Z1-6]
MRNLITLLVLPFCIHIAFGQEDTTLVLNTFLKEKSNSSWTDKFTIGGYMQLRNNDLYKTNPDLTSPQGDRTYGGYHGFSLRRMRMKISGQIHERVYFYFQADFASDGKNLGQLRDAYFDYSLDKEGRFKLRAGQSKVPYGFENLQSSQNRLAPDRDDPLNSAFKDERDLGIGIHYATKEVRQRFKDISKKGLKGTGDYGMINFTMINGQKANEVIPNVKKAPHMVLRASYPFLLSNGQYIEASLQGYTGQYTPTNISDDVNVLNRFDNNLDPIPALHHKFRDERIAASFVVYPQPFGIQAEYNFGKGPEYDVQTNTVDTKSLNGGYLQLMYMKKYKDQVVVPFARGQFYEGGKKFELDASSYNMKELELGIEWQPVKAFEFTALYVFGERTILNSKTGPKNTEKGQLLRIQLQINY